MSSSPDTTDYLLHTENLARMYVMGGQIEKWLCSRAGQVAEATAGLHDPDVSIVIRTRNDGKYIRQLIADIKAQIFDGAIELIVVDTESCDDTANYAKSQGAKIIHLTQDEFTYPLALNIGFQAASHPWVVTLVGHSGLSSRLYLKSLTYWAAQEKKLGGMYGLGLVNWNASVWERVEGLIRPDIWRKPVVIQELSLGIMGANSSIVSREAWERLGGYDERYAGGGEDRVLGESLLRDGMTIIREPLCSTYHTHGLSLRDTLRQWAHWSEVAKAPTPFETKKVHKRRPDLR